MEASRTSAAGAVAAPAAAARRDFEAIYGAGADDAAWRLLRRRALGPLERAAGRPLKILPLGRRAADRLGLEALDFPELERLPFEDARFDLVVYDGVFHFASDYRAALREARRLLGWGGSVVILGVPVYRSFVQGESDRAARHATFERRHGRPPNLIAPMEYLDERMLAELAAESRLRWRALEPWGGLPLRLTRLAAATLGLPEPPRRPVLIGSWTTG